MDSKLIAILAVVVVAAVGIGAFAAMSGNDDPAASDYLIVDGNGGADSSGKTTQKILKDSLVEVPDCFFTKEGNTFYQWNTKADGTGTFYKPGTDAATLKADGITNLYAYWGYSFTVSPIPLSSDFSFGLLKHGNIPTETYRLNPIILDSSVSNAAFVIAPTEERGAPNDWTFENNGNQTVIKADYGYYWFKFVISDIKGASDLTFQKGKDNVAAGVYFDYAGDVSFTFSFKMEYRVVTYDGNGGSHQSEGKDPITTFDHACDIVVPSKYFVNDGYKFVKWCNTADGTGDFSIVADDKGKFPEDSTSRLQLSGVTKLFAIWEKVA